MIDLEMNEVFDSDFWRDIDPDNNLLNNIFPTFDGLLQSSYFTLDNYNSEIFNSVKYFSIFHQNVRSLNNKFDMVTSFF